MSWRRSDEDFFAAGACHVLAASFLQEYPRAGFCAYLIKPEPGYRGSHVFVANGELAFDWNGYQPRGRLVHEYVGQLRAFFGTWQGSVLRVEDPVSSEFCKTHRHRHPSQFYRCPLERALRFVRRFPQPEDGRIKLLD